MTVEREGSAPVQRWLQCGCARPNRRAGVPAALKARNRPWSSPDSRSGCRSRARPTCRAGDTLVTGDAAEAKRAYGIALRPDLFTGASEGYDCLIGAVAHDQYRALGSADLARLVKPGGLIADVKGIWRGRELPAGRQRWQL